MLGRVGSDYAYPGCELSLFAAAKNWKQYFSHALEPYISGRVAEIGAGLGSTTLVLCQAQHMAWYAVEPDARLLSNLTASVRAGRLPPTVIPVTGSIDALVGEGTFDTILYVDVLEHIEDDRGELLKAAELLRVGGRLIVLSPAYQALYTAFDAQVGHFRRYTLPHLKAVGPAQLKCQAELIHLACSPRSSTGCFSSRRCQPPTR
jgi:SAM-dependent methyltransferase